MEYLCSGIYYLAGGIKELQLHGSTQLNEGNVALSQNSKLQNGFRAQRHLYEVWKHDSVYGSVPVFICLGCCNRRPQVGWLINNWHLLEWLTLRREGGECTGGDLLVCFKLCSKFGNISVYVAKLCGRPVQNKERKTTCPFRRENAIHFLADWTTHLYVW